MCRLVAAGLCGLLLGGSLEAQLLKKINPFDSIPEIAVTLTHPPRLGHQIQEIQKVVFAEAEGDCAEDFVDSLISDFVGNGVEVMERQNLDALMEEHQFAASGLVDPSTAQELGKILGATALIFVKVRRCTTNRESLQNHRKSPISNNTIYEYIAKTTAYFKGSVQVVDLKTARIHSARAIDESLVRSTSSSSGPPSPPDAYEAIDGVMRQAAARVHEMFFTWNERRSIRFYDDANCGLKLAYNFVTANQLEEAVEQSRINVESCEAFREKKPKLLARALYNLGAALCLSDDYSRGIDALTLSLRLRPHEPTSEAMAECKRAEQVAERMDRFSEEAGGSDLPAASSTAEAGSERTVEEQVTKLVGLYQNGLLEKDVCQERIETLLKERGSPGDTVEEKLQALKSYLEQGLIGQGVYDDMVEEVVATI